MKLTKKRSSRNILFLGGSSFFNDAGSEMITPILPFYINSLGGSGVAIGALSGLREGLSSLFKILGGWASDRIGKRKKFIFLGYLISVIAKLFLVLANTWQAILGLISIERLGKLRDAPRDAIIAISKRKTGKWFGIHQMMDTAGGILGTLLVIALFWILKLDFKQIILMAALIASLSLIPLFFVKEPKTKKIKRGLFQGIKRLDKKLKYFIFVSAIFTLANFGLFTFMILLAKDMTGSMVIAFSLYALFSFIFALFVIPFGRLSDKIGRKKLLMLGYISLFLLGISFVIFSGLIFLIFSFVLLGLVYALTSSNQRALVSDLAGEMKGTALGLFYCIIGLINIPAGIIAGFLFDINYKLMFGYVSVVVLISIILLSFVRER